LPRGDHPNTRRGKPLKKGRLLTPTLGEMTTNREMTMESVGYLYQQLLEEVGCSKAMAAATMARTADAHTVNRVLRGDNVKLGTLIDLAYVCGYTLQVTLEPLDVA
jgi:hypothetical protein